jgi:outer membrane lipoprotein-sorting protein
MRRLLLLTVAFFGAGLGVAQEQAPRPTHPLLEKVFSKGASLTYQGERIVTIRRRDNKETLYREVIAKKGANIKIKFFGATDINGQIIVENGVKRWHYIPERKEIRESPARQEESLMFLIGPMMMGGSGRPPSGQSGPRGGEPEKRREQGGQRGNGGGGQPRFEQRLAPVFKESDGGFVAGQRTRLLVISDSRSKQALMKLWIEPTHAVILKRLAFDPKGQLIGSFEFQTINFQPTFTATTFNPLSVPGAKIITVEDILRAEAKKLSLKPYRLVGDKEYLLLSARGFEQDHSKIMVMVYSNGRNRLTLFQVKGGFDPDKFKNEAGSRFITHTWAADGVNFAIVGNLELSKLKALAKKVKA